MSDDAILADQPCTWCKLVSGIRPIRPTTKIPGCDWALCATCGTDLLKVFDYETRQAAIEVLSQPKYNGNFCDDPECSSCNGIGADGHIC